MSRASAPAARRIGRLWTALIRWLRALMRRRPRLELAAGGGEWGDRAASLDPELRRSLDDVGDSAVVRDTVTAAIGHFCDLRDVVSGPGSFDLIGDLDLVAEAESLLREIISRAPDVSAVVAVARERGGDRAGREAAGVAVLALRDRTRTLGDVASAALVWGSSREPDDRAHLERCARRLCERERS